MPRVNGTVKQTAIYTQVSSTFSLTHNNHKKTSQKTI